MTRRSLFPPLFSVALIGCPSRALVHSAALFSMGCRDRRHPSDHHDMMRMMSGCGGRVEAVRIVGARPLERKRPPSRRALASPLRGNGHRLRGPQVALLRGNGHPFGAASDPDIAHRRFVFKMWQAGALGATAT